MSSDKQKVLVFGGTGQQGGSVAAARLKAGWQVRALVRDPASFKSRVLRDAGAEIVQGAFADFESVRRAMVGVYRVFSVQPGSGQGAAQGLSDEEEERVGIAIADLALENDLRHLV